jgi:hypothetical protein
MPQAITDWPATASETSYCHAKSIRSMRARFVSRPASTESGRSLALKSYI